MVNKMTLTVFVILLSCLLVMPAAAANGKQGQGNKAQQVNQGQGQGQGQAKGQVSPESKGRRLHREYFNKIEAMKAKRDQAMEMRMQLIQSNSSGNTGM